MKKLVAAEAGPIQVVGRALSDAEKKRLGQLAASERDLQHAEYALVRGFVAERPLDEIREKVFAPQPKRTPQ